MKNNKLLIGLGVALAVLLIFAVIGKKQGWVGKGGTIDQEKVLAQR